MTYSDIEDDILANAVTEEEYSLDKLQQWLKYAKHSWSLWAVIIWLPLFPIVTVLKILAVIFTPFMLWHLFKAKWYKSVVVFLIIVVLPYVIFLSIQGEKGLFTLLIRILPLITFYIYTYIISYMIGEYLIEIKTLNKWKREDKIKNPY